MFKIELFQTASVDLQEAYDWYESQLIGLGDRFITEIDIYLDRVSENPFRFPVQFSEKYRFALLKRYLIALCIALTNI